MNFNFLRTILSQIREFDNKLKEYTKSSEGSLPYLAYVYWGINLSQNENLEEAIEKLQTSAMMSPHSPVVHLNLGQVYMKKGDFNDAIRHFRKTIRLDSSSGIAYSLVAACLVLKEEFNDAETYYKKACEVSPDIADIRTNYATALAAKGKKYKALELYRDALKINKNHFMALHCSGVILSSLGRYEEACERLLAAENVVHDNTETLFNIAVCKFQLNEYETSLKYIEKALTIRNHFPEAMVVKGACLAKLEREDECLNCFNTSKNGNENNFQYYAYWGMALQHFGHYSEAKEKFLQAFELNREDEFVLFNLGENYLQEGNSLPALNLFQKIVANNKQNSNAFEKIGNILYSQEKYKEALEAYSNGIKASRKHLYLYNKMAECYYNLDDYKNSAAYYVKAIEYNPELIEAYTGYIKLLLKTKNIKEAQRKIRAAYKKAPDSVEVLSLYSQILIQAEMYHDALEKLDKLITIAPDFYQGIYTKAEVLNLLKKPEEAIELLQTLPEKLHDTKEFLYISMISYNNLAHISPSHYNVDKAIEYCDCLTDKYSSEYNLNDIRQKLTETLKTIEGE
ncbi:MAG: tetratricopeptide repeat protein [Candidatus Gastranaerophilaceae bacterium]